MPIYHYATTSGRKCAHCEHGFDCLQRLSNAALEHCPQCGGSVARQISAPSTVIGGKHRLKEKHVEKHGFTQYRRIGKGVYEKTAGKGPRHISDD